MFDAKRPSKSMLIVVAHGSRNAAWRASVERQIEAVRADVGRDALRLAYMELSPPTLFDVTSQAAQLDVVNIRILPLFLASEGHVEKDILPAVEQLRETFSSIHIELLPPFGQLPLFRELLRAIADEESP